MFLIQELCATKGDDNYSTVTCYAQVYVNCVAVSASLRVDICKTTVSKLCDDPRETEEKNLPHHPSHAKLEVEGSIIFVQLLGMIKLGSWKHPRCFSSREKNRGSLSSLQVPLSLLG